MRRWNNNPLRQRFVFGVQLWEEAHWGGGADTKVCVHMCTTFTFFWGRVHNFPSDYLLFEKKGFLNEFKLQAFVPQVLFATVICPDCK